MYEFKVENSAGETLNLSKSNRFDVLEVDGLYPPAVTLNTTPYASQDGSYTNSKKIPSRPLTITIRIRQPVDINRNILYKYFYPKRNFKFYVKTRLNDVYISGQVETMPITMFSQSTIATVSAICSDPYFYDVASVTDNFQIASKLFEFPFEINADGIELSSTATTTETVITVNESSGFLLTIKNIGSGTITKPSFENLSTGELIKFTRSMTSGEEYVISTYFSKKSITVHRTNGLGDENGLSYLLKGSKLFLLQTGINKLRFSADSNADQAQLSLTTVNKYLGI